MFSLVFNSQAQIEELKQQLESESGLKNKAEKVKAGLQKLVDDLSEKLDEESYQCKLLTEQLQKKESEISKLQTEFDEAQNQFEVQNLTLKKKYHDNQQELTDQIDNLHKIRHRLEKEKHLLQREFENVQAEAENFEKFKMNIEKGKKTAENSALELKTKLENTLKELQITTNAKNQLMKENSTLTAQLQGHVHSVTMATKVKETLTEQLNEARSAMEELMKQSSKVYDESKMASQSYKALEAELEEEKERNSLLQKQLLKVQQQLNSHNNKRDDTSMVIKVEEHELVKRKLAGRISELEGQLEGVLSKCLGLEKVKGHLQSHVDNMEVALDKSNAASLSTEKKLKQLEKNLSEYKNKENILEKTVEEQRRELRSLSGEIVRLKNDLHDGAESITLLNKNNHRLTEEINDMVEQNAMCQKKCMELEKNVKRLDMEKEALGSALEEAESMLSEQSTRQMRAVQDTVMCKDENEKLLSEKDAEIAIIKRTHQRTIDELQSCLEEENRLRMEVMREKQMIQQELAEVLGIVEETTKSNEDSGKQIKKLIHKINDLERELDDERDILQQLSKEKEEVEGKLASHAFKGQESQMEMVALERANKTLQSELKESNGKIQQLKELANKLVDQKKSLEAAVLSLQGDLEDKTSEYQLSLEQLKKTSEEASVLAQQLQTEQERGEDLERTSRSLEEKLKQVVSKLHEVEASAMQRYTDRLNAILNSSSMTIDGSKIFDANKLANIFPKNTSVETTDMPISNMSVSTRTANLKSDAESSTMKTNIEPIPVYKTHSKTAGNATKNNASRKNSVLKNNSNAETNCVYKTFSAAKNVAAQKPGNAASATNNNCQRKDSKADNKKSEAKTSKIALKRFSPSPERSVSKQNSINKQQSLSKQEKVDEQDISAHTINTAELFANSVVNSIKTTDLSENSVANTINTQLFTKKNEQMNQTSAKLLTKNVSSPNNLLAPSTISTSTGKKSFTGSSMVFRKIKGFPNETESVKEGPVKKALENVASKISKATFKHASTDAITNNMHKSLACVSTILENHRRKKCFSTACSRSFRSNKAIYERKQTTNVPLFQTGGSQSGSGIGAEDSRAGNGPGAGATSPCRECEVTKKTGETFERSCVELPTKQC